MPKTQLHPALTWLASGALLLAADRARAFSDPLSYADSVDVGGGAGRWFTGSVADGFGCDVCHEGGAPVDLTIRGLPTDSFVPGVAYEVDVSWPANLENAALIAELVDEQRHAAGTIALPRPEAMKPSELCDVQEGGAPPSELHPTEDGRVLLSLVDCGAKTLRFQWTAPFSASSPVWLDIGFVASNADTTPAGDGVTMVRRPISGARTDLGTQTIAQGCSAAPGLERGFIWLCPLLALPALRARARHRRRSCS